MRKPLLAFALLAALTSPAFAGPCVALEYQEMKDMSVEELAKEHCKIGDAWTENMDQKMINLQTSTGPKPYPNADDNFDQCYGQIQRIERVLESKGMSKDAANKACDAIHAEQKSKK